MSMSKITPTQIEQAWKNLQEKSRKAIHGKVDEDILQIQQVFDAAKPKWTMEEKNQKIEEALHHGFEEQFKELLQHGASISLEKVIKAALDNPNRWEFVALAHRYHQTCQNPDTPWTALLKSDFENLDLALSHFKILGLTPSQEVIHEVWSSLYPAVLDSFFASDHDFFPKVWDDFYQKRLEAVLDNRLSPDAWDCEEGTEDEVRYIQSVTHVMTLLERYVQKNPGLNPLKAYQGGPKGTQAWEVLFDALDEEVSKGDLQKLLSWGVYPEPRVVSKISNRLVSWPWFAAEQGAESAFRFLMQDKTQQHLCEEDAQDWNGEISTLPPAPSGRFPRLILPTLDRANYDFAKDPSGKSVLFRLLESLKTYDSEHKFTKKELEVFFKHASLFTTKKNAKSKSIFDHVEAQNPQMFKMNTTEHGGLSWNDFKAMMEQKALKKTLPARQTTAPKVRI